jgi:putative membrane protein
MYMLLHLAILALTILALSRFVPTVRIRSAGTAVVVAIVFSVLNFFLGWLIRAVLFVPAILTLGLLFLFVPFLVNAVLLWITDKLMKSFEIASAGGLVVTAGVITLVNMVFNAPYVQSVWQTYTNGSGQVVHPRWI